MAYPLNRIPASDFDPASVTYEKVFPTYSGVEAPGKIGGTVNYFRPTVQSYDEYLGRVDHDFGTRDHLFGHYYSNYFDQAPIYNPTNLASYTSYFNTRYQNALLSETHTFTNNLLNNLVLNYQRKVALRGGPPGSPKITAFGVTNIWQPETGPYLQATITGYFGASSSAFAAWFRNNYTFNDDLHWVKGTHNFAFGGHFELSKFDVTNVFQSYGTFGFNTATNTIGGTTYQYPNAMANFQMGFMGGSSLQPGQLRARQRPQPLPRHLRAGQLEGHSPPDRSTTACAGKPSLPGRTGSASRPHSVPPTTPPTSERRSSAPCPRA